METKSSMEWNETLLKMARRDIYRINAFRVLNISVTASSKEIHAHSRKHDLMEKYASVENQDLNIFPLSITRDHSARQEALQRLLDPELRFIDEFFWFWPLSLNATEDNDEAYQAIIKNDLTDALSIWKGREAQGSEANVSMHNLAVLYHAMALDVESIETRDKTISKQQVEQKRDYWEQAFTRWKMLLKDEGFWHRVQERLRDLDDPRLTNDTARRIREGLPKALLSINAMLAVEAAEMNDPADAAFHLMTMKKSGFDNSAILEAIRRALTPIRNHLKAMYSRALEEIRDAPERGNKVASNLINDTAPLLKNLDMLLPEGDPTRESTHDEAALQVNSCLIAYINDTEDWHAASKIAEEALSIAESSSLRQKIKDDLEAIRLNIEYTTCWFCGKNNADSNSSVTVIMHGNVEHERKFFNTEVRWQQLPVIVPRCNACKSAHEPRYNLGCGGAIVGLILAAIIGFASSNFLVGLVIFAVCWLLGYITSLLIFPKGIKRESYKNEFRTVKEMLSRGWKLGKPEGVSQKEC